MIDIANEHTVLLTKASQWVPGRPHVSTFWRWFNRGVRGHKLETVVIGGRRYTSREALQRFFVHLNEAPLSQAARPDRSRELALERVEQQLTDLGIE